MTAETALVWGFAVIVGAAALVIAVACLGAVLVILRAIVDEIL